uniref:Fibronectin type-III domain-containing protein n=1 Tax=Trichuris muris TaxID=70415 RepID=A0A5S6R3A3_TRIMR
MAASHRWAAALPARDAAKEKLKTALLRLSVHCSRLLSHEQACNAPLGFSQLSRRPDVFKKSFRINTDRIFGLFHCIQTTSLMQLIDFHLLVFGSALLLARGAAGDETKKVHQEPPLLFQMDPEDPRMVAIFWNQRHRLKKIKEISTREVYYRNTSNFETPLIEEYDHWQPLLVDEEDTKKVSRFVLLRHELCREKEFRVLWYDRSNALNEAELVRLGPSPLAWKQKFSVDAKDLRYNPDTGLVTGKLLYTPTVEIDRDTISVFLTIQSSSCDVVFHEWILEPTVDPKTGEFSFPLDYLKHQCALRVHLNKRVYDHADSCLQLYRTDSEHSPTLDIPCRSVQGLSCPVKHSAAGECNMDCLPAVETATQKGAKESGFKPYVTVSWSFSNNRQPVKKQMARTAEVDYAWNNHPVAEFNITTKSIERTVSSIDLYPFAKIKGSFYELQICAFFDDCKEEPNWSKVPKLPIMVTDLLLRDNLLGFDEDAEEVPEAETTAVPTTQPTTLMAAEPYHERVGVTGPKSLETVTAQRALPASTITVRPNSDGNMNNAVRSPTTPRSVPGSALTPSASIVLTGWAAFALFLLT